MQALILGNLRKVYPSGLEALKEINLQVEEGDFFALLGPNGAGKSTAIGIIASLVQKTSGKVTVFGFDLARQTASAKACIGLVPQEFNFNIFERVIDILINQAGYYGIGRATALKRAEKYLSLLGLWEKRDQPARALSGGMKRRLMIARALVHEPRMLILDEPTAGVDLELRHSMWSFLKTLNAEGTTIILTTHYLEEAEQLCRGIAIIDRGRIVVHTTLKALLSELDTQVVLLDLTHPLTERTPVLPGYDATRIDDYTLEITLSKTQNLNGLFQNLSDNQLEVVGLRNKTNRLESLFMRLTAPENLETMKTMK